MKDASTLIVYEKPTCTTCRKMVKLLKERGVDFDRLNYFIEPLSREKLVALLDKMGTGPQGDPQDPGAPVQGVGSEGPQAVSEKVLRECPGSLPRTGAATHHRKGERAVLGRPLEAVLELL